VFLALVQGIGFVPIGEPEQQAGEAGPTSLHRIDAVVDKLELRVAVDVRRSFGRLVIRLKAVAAGIEQLSDLLWAELRAERAGYPDEEDDPAAPAAPAPKPAPANATPPTT
jgi:hypothetical protein